MKKIKNFFKPTYYNPLDWGYGKDAEYDKDSSKYRVDPLAAVLIIAIIVLFVASWAISYLYGANKGLRQQLETCTHNFKAWSDQIESGQILLKLK